MLSIDPGMFTKRPAFRFRPDFIAESVHDIDFTRLKSVGITTCLVDLDNTVVERGAFEVSTQVREALDRSGLDIYIATNRPKSRDLKNLKEALGAKGVVHPHGIFAKPTKRYFKNALKDFGLDRRSVIMIGDRYIQDIFGANKAGIYSLLVHKLGKPFGRTDAFISRLELSWTRHISKRYYPR